jgi:HPt (histidine-containing phosphotransfer) domain-containing protein
MTESQLIGEVSFAPHELEERCLKNIDLARRVVQTFLAHGEHDVKAIEQSVSLGQADETARVAHRLKGGSDNVAAHRLCGLAAELERLARQGSLDLVPQVGAIRSEWDRFAGSAREFLAPAQARSSTSTNN